MKKRMLTSALLLILVCCGAAAQIPARGHYFRRYLSSDDLPNNAVYDISRDSRGIVWLGTQEGLVRFDGSNFSLVRDENFRNGVAGHILAVEADSKGRVWFCQPDGLCHVDPESFEVRTSYKGSFPVCGRIVADDAGGVWMCCAGQVYRFDTSDGSMRTFPYEEIYATDAVLNDSGEVWFASGDGVSRFDYKLGRFEHFKVLDDAEQKREVIVRHVAADGDGTLVLSTSESVILRVSTSDWKRETLFSAEDNERPLLVRSIAVKKRGDYWVGTEAGIFIWANGSLSRERNDKTDPNALSGQDICCLEADAEGNVWVGMFYNGLDVCVNTNDSYSLLYENNRPGSLKGELVRAIAPASEGKVLIATEDGEINLYDALDGSVSQLRIKGGPAKHYNFQHILVDNDLLWVSTFGNGLLKLRKADLTYLDSYVPIRQVVCSVKDDDGVIYFGGSNGLYMVYPDGHLDVCRELSDCFVHAMAKDPNGTIWVGTYGKGLWYIDKRRGSAKQYSRTTVEGVDLTYSSVTSFYDDSGRRLYITTEGNGLIYGELAGRHPSEIEFHSLTREDGLPSNITSSVLMSRDGWLWVGTSKGLAAISPVDFSIREVDLQTDCVIGEQFSYNGAWMSHDGVAYMGLTKGCLVFFPSRISVRLGVDGAPHITDVVASGNHGDRSLVFDRAHGSGIRVKAPEVSSLTFRCSSPSFFPPFRCQYEYTLRHGRKVSKVVSTRPEITFAGMQPGKYVFTVSLKDSRSPESVVSLPVRVMPPLYSSTPALVLYALVFLTFIGLMVCALLRRKTMENDLAVEKIEKQTQKELYQSKINFFTNITHEIRTPLTLIKMPLEKIISNRSYKPEAEKDIFTIQANANRLLNLVNQLLDLRRIGNKSSQPEFTSNDISAIVRNTCGCFESVAADQRINFVVDVSPAPLMVDCSPDIIQKILSNLLSNAVKYCRDYVKVSLETVGDNVRIRVDSNGEILTERERRKAFELFWQSSTSLNAGTGLGLPYARSLAESHNGRLFVDAEVSDCNSFVLEIPVHQDKVVTAEEGGVSGGAPAVADMEPREAELLAQESGDNRHSILIVDDDEGMRGYIAKELSDEYTVLVASNGEEAVSVIRESKVDLVISDIMMPKMDGLQLCNYIKSTVEFSHIPVILLTAAVGMETRISTLKEGADGYIEKPFSMDLLRANVANLFKNKDIAFHQFANAPLSHFSGTVVNKTDREFMDKLHNIVTAGLSEENMNAESLADMMGTSKSTLFRKIKANTGLGPNEYIRLCRLKKAAELLSSGNYRVSEVAYLVGFSSPSYFATCFTKQFNISPSAFLANLTNK